VTNSPELTVIAPLGKAPIVARSRSQILTDPCLIGGHKRREAIHVPQSICLRICGESRCRCTFRGESLYEPHAPRWAAPPLPTNGYSSVSKHLKVQGDGSLTIPRSSLQVVMMTRNLCRGTQTPSSCASSFSFANKEF
jgi:hypothetical protein